METETIRTLIMLQYEPRVMNICMTPSIDDANNNFRYDRCEGHVQVFYALY